MGAAPVKTHTFSLSGTTYAGASHMAGPFNLGYFEKLKVVDYKGSKLDTFPAQPSPRIAAFTLNYLVIITHEIRVHDMSLENYPCLHTINLSGGGITYVATSGNLLIGSVNINGKPLRVYNLTEGKLERELLLPSGGYVTVNFIAAAKDFASAIINSSKLVTWNINDGSVVGDTVISVPAASFKLWDNYAYISSYGGNIDIVDIFSGKTINKVSLNFSQINIGNPILHQNDDGLIMAGFNYEIRVFSPETKSVIYSFSFFLNGGYASNYNFWKNYVTVMYYRGKSMCYHVAEIQDENNNSNNSSKSTANS